MVERRCAHPIRGSAPHLFAQDAERLLDLTAMRQMRDDDPGRTRHVRREPHVEPLPAPSPNKRQRRGVLASPATNGDGGDTEGGGGGGGGGGRGEGGGGGGWRARGEGQHDGRCTVRVLPSLAPAKRATVRVCVLWRDARPEKSNGELHGILTRSQSVDRGGGARRLLVARFVMLRLVARERRNSGKARLGIPSAAVINVGSGCIVSRDGHVLTAAHLFVNPKTNQLYQGKAPESVIIAIGKYDGDANPSRRLACSLSQRVGHLPRPASHRPTGPAQHPLHRWSFWAELLTPPEILRERDSSRRLLDLAVLRIRGSLSISPPIFDGRDKHYVVEEKGNDLPAKFDSLRLGKEMDVVSGSPLLVLGWWVAARIPALPLSRCVRSTSHPRRAAILRPLPNTTPPVSTQIMTPAGSDPPQSHLNPVRAPPPPPPPPPPPNPPQPLTAPPPPLHTQAFS